MKQLFFLSSFLFPLFAFSQYLTVGQVFDYQPGDVIQRMLEQGTFTSSAPPVYEKDSILSRTNGVDTVTYSVYRQIRTQDSFYPYAFHYYDSTLNIGYGNLNDSATMYVHSTDSSCLPPYIVFDTCAFGFDQWSYQAASDTSCFEPPNWKYAVIRGCGGPYHYWYHPDNNNTWNRCTLVGVRKGGISYGIILDVGNPYFQSSGVRVFPNPFNDQIVISSYEGRYYLSDHLGRMVRSDKVRAREQVDLKELTEGIYLLHLYDQKNPVTVRIVKIP